MWAAPVTGGLDQDRVRQAVGRAGRTRRHAPLADDLAGGRRRDRHQDLLDADALDVGYRLVTAGWSGPRLARAILDVYYPGYADG
ncbi:hypothetical protein [Nonomuraea rhodomycinica]|uniref:Uncharacterized protein n=1 Tax=Nonomuraea rhodomycinica TaxID=1712872 RepID=A0A7Y6MCI2_9ACTN|nr:hypothetical protein [Nonomuraea rhodomycinica]NUW43413.1 hypothetical protein [Nonomuraea rhodomycinica]